MARTKSVISQLFVLAHWLCEPRNCNKTRLTRLAVIFRLQTTRKFARVIYNATNSVAAFVTFFVMHIPPILDVGLPLKLTVVVSSITASRNAQVSQLHVAFFLILNFFKLVYMKLSLKNTQKIRNSRVSLDKQI